MRGVIWDLAEEGYLAVAADYMRKIKGDYKRSLFAWHCEKDVTAALEIVEREPLVDRERIATLGFSQGGVFSLLIAAAVPEKVKTVVAYYPVTDFEHWLYDYRRTNPMQRAVFRIIRWYFRKESGARTEEEFRVKLKNASPLHHLNKIKASVLLIHGELDRSAPVDESRRLYERLREAGIDTELTVIPGAGHVFNFKDPQQATTAWDATLRWLYHHTRQ
ncbi:MAG: alpha/beta fold hydrolase [Acidobacteriota bacterium]